MKIKTISYSHHLNIAEAGKKEYISVGAEAEIECAWDDVQQREQGWVFEFNMLKQFVEDRIAAIRALREMAK